MPSDWQRLDADPALRAEVRRRYTGTGDPLDVLWWLEHPGEPTPGGAPDPARAAEAARRDLFSRAGGTASPEEVGRAAARAEADGAAARRALAQADTERRAAPAHERPDPSSRRPATAVLAGAVVAVLAVGGVAGFGLGRFVSTGDPAALAVFDRAQQPDDRPPPSVALPRAVVPASVRHLGDSSTTGVAVYAAEAADDRVCLLAVVLASRFVATCSTRATFAVEGLSMSLQAAADPTDDSGAGTLQEVDPRWSPGGRLTF